MSKYIIQDINPVIHDFLKDKAKQMRIALPKSMVFYLLNSPSFLKEIQEYLAYRKLDVSVLSEREEDGNPRGEEEGENKANIAEDTIQS